MRFVLPPIAIVVLRSGRPLIDVRTTAVTVGDVMTGDVRAVRDDAILDYALREMRRYSVRRAPVVRANGSLVAVISVDDVNEHLATQLTWLAGDAKPP